MSPVVVEAVRIASRPTRRNLLHWASWAVALAIQCSAVLILRNGRIYSWEAEVTREFQRIPVRREIFNVANYFTNTIAWEFVPLFALVVGIAVMRRHFVGAALLLLTFPLHVLAQWPKAIVDRQRPPAQFTGIEGLGDTQSFPSGHAEFVITFWGFVAFLVLLHANGRRSRLLIVGGVSVFALATGFGRIAIGRHWPLDILVSYVVGFGLLSGLIWIYVSVREAQDRSLR